MQDSWGSKNQPQYSGVGIPADAADLSQLGNYAALVGNRKALTSAQRVALTGNDRWAGLEVFETDTGTLWLYTTAWSMIWADVIGSVKRSSTTTTFPSSYTNMSANTFWTNNIAHGITAYNNGWKVPYAGIYRVAVRMTAADTFLAGVTVNKTAGVGIGDFVASGSANPVQGVAVVAFSELVALSANDVLTIFALAASGTPAWQQNYGSEFQVEWVRAL